MKRGIITLIFMVLLSCSFISAEIIFTQQVNSVYNLGDTVPVPVTIKTNVPVTDNFQMDLICDGNSINFYRNGVNLNAGDEKTIDSYLVLVKNVIGQSKGVCGIKASLGSEYVLSSEFKISDLLKIDGSIDKSNANPGDAILLKGNVVKENGENSDGFIEADIMTNDVNQNITQIGTVNDGSFNFNVSLPESLRAGNYIIELKAYEKDSEGVITNNGISKYNLSVNQIPTNLEIVIENKQINPGDSLKVKVILHDQTGDSISTTSFVTIKDSNNKILEQKDIQTNQFFEYSTKTNQPPAEWKVYASSGQLTAEDDFNINPIENVSIEIVNKTILVTNIGNIPYNKTFLVKIGDTPLNIYIKLNVGESKKYVLSAPNGQYQIEVTGANGNDAAGTVSLTGGAIDIKEISNGYFGAGIWIFLILILGATVFVIFRKIYKKPFVGKKMNFNFKKRDSEETTHVLGANSITRITNKAELSLSIKGEKQEASVICLRVKNLKESGRGSSILESVQKIKSLIEENKGVTYENQDYLFFIFAPAKTRTFKNEKTALDVAEEMEKILTEHNKMFSQKIDFGISLNHGTIVGKIENGVFKFMSMGPLITAAKKIAHLSKEEVLLSSEINDLLRLQIRTEKSVREGVPVFKITEIKRENKEATKFIDSFLRRQGKE